MTWYIVFFNSNLAKSQTMRDFILQQYWSFCSISTAWSWLTRSLRVKSLIRNTERILIKLRGYGGNKQQDSWILHQNNFFSNKRTLYLTLDSKCSQTICNMYYQKKWLKKLTNVELQQCSGVYEVWLYNNWCCEIFHLEFIQF